MSDYTERASVQFYFIQMTLLAWLKAQNNSHSLNICILNGPYSHHYINIFHNILVKQWLINFE